AAVLLREPREPQRHPVTRRLSLDRRARRWDHGFADHDVPVGSMRTLAMAVALGGVAALMPTIEADRDDLSLGKPAYVLVDAASEHVLDARWDDLERPVPVGSLIKPF